MVRVLLAALMFALLPACAPTPAATGSLAGHVTIGPLAPVAIAGQPEPTPPPEVYAARRVVVRTADGARELAQLTIDAQGSYRVDLPAGVYQIDINRSGMDSAAGLPAQVEVRAGATTTLDISIDTGIR